MNQADFQIEDEKYSYLWANGYKSARWKLLAQALLDGAKAAPHRPRIADFGSGRGDAVEFFSRKGFEATGIDVSRFAVEKLRGMGYPCFWASLDSLGEIPDNSFEFGFSNDVLEHIDEKHVDGALSEMERVCSHRLYLSICPTPSKNKSREGENLHLTVRPKAWWEEKLRRIGAVREVKFFLSRSIRYEIIIEKRNGPHVAEAGQGAL